MLGLKQFSTPQFMVPTMPATERPFHKVKDFLSFLNSLQWKVKDNGEEEEEEAEEAESRQRSKEGLQSVSSNFDTLTNGLDWNIGNPFVGRKLDSDGISGLSDEEMRDRANESLVHGGALNFGSPLDTEKAFSNFTPKEYTQPLSDEDKEIAENFGKTIDDLWYNAVRKGKSDAYWNGAPFMTPEGRI